MDDARTKEAYFGHFLWTSWGKVWSRIRRIAAKCGNRKNQHEHSAFSNKRLLISTERSLRRSIKSYCSHEWPSDREVMIPLSRMPFHPFGSSCRCLSVVRAAATAWRDHYHLCTLCIWHQFSVCNSVVWKIDLILKLPRLSRWLLDLALLSFDSTIIVSSLGAFIFPQGVFDYPKRLVQESPATRSCRCHAAMIRNDRLLRRRPIETLYTDKSKRSDLAVEYLWHEKKEKTDCLTAPNWFWWG